MKGHRLTSAQGAADGMHTGSGGRGPGEGLAVPEHTTLQGDKTQRKGLGSHSGLLRHRTQDRKGNGDFLHSLALPPRDKDQHGLRGGWPLRCGEQAHFPSGFLKALAGLPHMLPTRT